MSSPGAADDPRRGPDGRDTAFNRNGPAAHPLWIEIRRNGHLAFPIIAAQIVQMAIIIADEIMVGRLGSIQLAAVAIGAYMIIIPELIGFGILTSVSALGAQAHGADDHDKLSRVARAGLILTGAMSLPILAVVFAIPFTLPGLGTLLGSVLGTGTGYDPRMLPLIAQYVFVGALGAPAFLFYTAVRNFVTVLGRTYTIPVISVLALALGLFTNYLFIYGNWGMPRLGIVGAGLSFFVLNWFQFLAIAWYAHRTEACRAYRPFQVRGSFDLTLLAEMFRVGWPAAASILFEAGLFVVSSLLMALFGQAWAAAYGAALAICSMSFMVPMSIGQAATVCVGRAVGARDFKRAKLAGYAGIVLGTSWMVCAAIGIAVFPRALIGVFLNDHESGNLAAIEAGLALLPIAALFQIVDGLQTTAIGALRGYNDTRWPMMIALFGYWVLGMGSSLVLGFGLDLGGRGLFWGLAVGLASVAIMLSWRFVSYRPASAGAPQPQRA
ncbi:MAG TPA: MATE family efflux transporter [Dongiaceae bacterium]|jgi:MATE family multidrug resistance protein|nr:MATE family efflux transporter [Dongiaceae bacterium]